MALHAQGRKSLEQHKRQEAASRMAYLRSEKFVLEGFGHWESATFEEARSMALRNLGRMRNQRPQPIVG